MPIEIVRVEPVHKGWTTFSIATIRMEDGRTVTREVEDHGRAACVLAYDPDRRVALLVRQFRAPAFLAAKKPDLLEAIAGIVDETDSREAARREALEEAGVALHELEHVGEVWTTPGISTERMDLFLAPYRSHDRTGPGGGVASEYESIAVVEMKLGTLAEMADKGELSDLKTFALLQTLRLRRPDLFAA